MDFNTFRNRNMMRKRNHILRQIFDLFFHGCGGEEGGVMFVTCQTFQITLLFTDENQFLTCLSKQAKKKKKEKKRANIISPKFTSKDSLKPKQTESKISYISLHY